MQQEKEFDLVVRLEGQYRNDPVAIGNILVATPGGQHIPLKELADISVSNGASFIYRENNSRFIGVQFSVEGRDLAGAVEDAMAQVSRARSCLPQGYRTDWGGEYSEYTASRAQLMAIVPLTLLLIFLLLFFLYRNFKFPAIALIGVLMSAPGGRNPCALAHRKPLLGFVGNRLPRPLRSLGADGARLHLLRQ